MTKPRLTPVQSLVLAQMRACGGKIIDLSGPPGTPVRYCCPDGTIVDPEAFRDLVRGGYLERVGDYYQARGSAPVGPRVHLDPNRLRLAPYAMLGQDGGTGFGVEATERIKALWGR